MNIEEFWNKVRKIDSCWYWEGTKNGNGYGRPRVAGALRYAHRLALELETGQPIGDGLHVLHSCDNPACVRPSHLSIGSHADNMADAKQKGRFASGDRNWLHNNPDLYRGEGNPGAKLTEEQVASIRAARSVRQKDIAAQYGISQSAVSLIRSGKRW